MEWCTVATEVVIAACLIDASLLLAGVIGDARGRALHAVACSMTIYAMQVVLHCVAVERAIATRTFDAFGTRPGIVTLAIEFAYVAAVILVAFAGRTHDGLQVIRRVTMITCAAGVAQLYITVSSTLARVKAAAVEDAPVTGAHTE